MDLAAPGAALPEYPSGHACVSSATVAQALENLFGAGHVDMDIRR